MKKGNPIALLPIGVFLGIYLGLGLLFEYGMKIPMGFYNIPIIIAFLAAILVACLQNRSLSFDDKLSIMGQGVGDKNIITMLLIFLAAGTFVGAVLWFIINNTAYMTDRINVWQDPWIDPRGDGFQPIQSLIAIGSGGLLGRGLGNSNQKFLYLPETENDYVFPIVVEELGFIGGLLVLLLFAALILRGYWLALHARDKFGTLLVVGVTTLLAVQVFLNIGVVTTLLPATGISLPFFSYGGTALMIQLAEMGIILSVSRQIPAPKKD